MRPVHAKAMPVVLTTVFECKQWLNAPVEALEGIQARVLAAHTLEVLSDEEAAQYVGAYLE